YRFVREVAAVKDSFVGEGRRGVLLRQPRLGAVVEISGCLADCDDSARWARIYPEEQRPQKGRGEAPRLVRRPLVPSLMDPSPPGGDPGLLLPWAPAPPG